MEASNFKKMWVCSVFLICISLAILPGIANALPFAKSTVSIDWGSLDIDIDGLTLRYHDQYVNEDDNKHIQDTLPLGRITDTFGLIWG